MQPRQVRVAVARQGFPSGEVDRLLALMPEIDLDGLRSLLDPLRGR